MTPSKHLALILCAVLLLCACIPGALAAQNNFYIIPDSNSRYLTEAELWDWQYEALGYIYNEIFARHGRPFRAGQKYDLYFRSQAWYTPDPDYSYNRMNRIEVANQQLAHRVLEDMRAQKTTNPKGRPLPTGNDDATLSSAFSFRSYNLIGGQRLAVYTGPGTWYFRAANGKALVSTNGGVRIAGVENGWMLVEYETSGSARRVGYVEAATMRDNLSIDPLNFFAQDAVITASRCNLTDDPNGVQGSLASLAANTQVLLLGEYASNSRSSWCYIEVETNQGTMRGFVPAQCVSVTGASTYDWTDELTADGDNG